MAQLEGLMHELDIINEKLIQMNGLLNNALEKFQELQTRAAEHRNEADESIREACSLDEHIHTREVFLKYIYCPFCGLRLRS
jgi:hypothetical protein